MDVSRMILHNVSVQDEQLKEGGVGKMAKKEPIQLNRRKKIQDGVLVGNNVPAHLIGPQNKKCLLHLALRKNLKSFNGRNNN